MQKTSNLERIVTVFYRCISADGDIFNSFDTTAHGYQYFLNELIGQGGERTLVGKNEFYFPKHDLTIQVQCVERKPFLSEQQARDRAKSIKFLRNQAMLDELSYITYDFIRSDASINGARLSDEDCQTILEEARRLHARGEFNHTGIYWIANHLAAEGKVSPRF